MTEQVGESDAAALRERLAGASNVLVLAPAFGEGVAELCTDLLAGDAPETAAVVAVTYRRTPRDWMEEWYDRTGTPPARGLVVSVGGEADTHPDVAPAVAENWRVEAVGNAANLTELGIALSESLTETVTDDERGSPRLCFDSLTTLLQYADLKPAFRFCHALTGRVAAAEAVGYYHLDPAAHDEQTLATVKGLFDAIVERDGSGTWTVRTR